MGGHEDGSIERRWAGRHLQKTAIIESDREEGIA